MKTVCLIFSALSFLLQASAQDYVAGQYVRTFAGSPAQGNSDGHGAQAKFYFPTYQAADASSNLYVCDFGNAEIRKITPARVVTTIAAASGVPLGMAAAPDGFIWSLIKSGEQNQLGRLSTNGDWQFYPVSFDSVADTNYGPDGFCVDSQGKFYTTIQFQVVQFNQFGAMIVYAAGSNFVSASSIVASDGQDNIYVADWGGSMILKVDTNHVVSTFAGFTRPSFPYYPPNTDGPVSTATFFGIINMVPDGSGGLYAIVAGTPYTYGTAVRHIHGGTVDTLAGSFFDPLPFTPSNVFVNGAGNVSRFFGAFSLCPIGERLMVADSWNNCIREISTNAPTLGTPATLAINASTNAILDVTADIGSVHEILVSPDLLNWTAQDTLLITNTPSTWLDTNAVNGSKFYRTLFLE